MKLTQEQVARVLHETNRAFCKAIGDDTQVPWDDAPEWQRDSVIAGINCGDLTPEQRHQTWCDYKTDDGWVYGQIKDADAKTHPCLVSCAELPEEQRTKDYLFDAVLQTLSVFVV